MQPDSINAIGMITMAFFTAVATLIFRTRRLKDVSWRTRIPAAFGGCLIALIVISMQHQRCLELPEPFGRFKLTALCLFIIILFVKKELIIGACIFLLIFAGAKLERDFSYIVHFSPGFTTIDANTGRPMAKGCNDGKSDEGIVVVKSWHTWFTGIYKM